MSAVKDRHIDFARALVKLAREHRMDSLQVTFRDSFSARADDHFSHEQMTMNWHEGRHGDLSNIVIRCEASVSIPEEQKDA